jgi:methionyl-tRNA formyltransferase
VAAVPARIAYLGTPDLAVPPLRALVAAGHEVALVVTRPDARRGRGAEVTPSPVKAEAERLGLAVSDVVGDVADAGVELAAVVAFGRIIPAAVLERVPMVNLHFSLLPRWRGAAPVERAILAGDAVTGVCAMAVEEGLDTGAVYASEDVRIGSDEHLAALRARLVEIGSALLVRTLAGGAAGLPVPVPQQGEATYAEKIRSEELELHWDRPAEELLRIVRLDRAWTVFRGQRLRVLEAAVTASDLADVLEPGRLQGALVGTGAGVLELRTVQPQGRAPVAAADWLRGARLAADERLE